MWEMAGARCSRRLKTQKEWMIRSFFRRIAAFKIGRAEVSQKYVTTSDHPKSDPLIGKTLLIDDKAFGRELSWSLPAYVSRCPAEY